MKTLTVQGLMYLLNWCPPTLPVAVFNADDNEELAFIDDEPIVEMLTRSDGPFIAINVTFRE